ncbi:MAG: mitochondrial fission ELM1 family protein [Candidatus Omnitrophica bacterium]|nr:mitochondrial fission ELM1 family protein [Candidatus Omnitrophota bacterium]
MDAFLDGTGYWTLRLIAFWVRRLPLETSLALGRAIGRAVHFFSRRRRVAYTHLKAAFPHSAPRERKQWTRELFEHLGMSGVEIMRVPVLSESEINRYVTNHGYENYLELRQSGRGLILLTAHLGNWELSQIAEGLRGRPMTVLTRRQKHKQLDRLLSSFRQYYGSRAVDKGSGIRDLIRTLRQGGSVGVLGDQSGGKNGVWVRFFGRLTTAPRGPMALALKFGVPVLPVFMVRRKGPCHDLYFRPDALELVRTGDYEKDIEINTQRYIEILESTLARYPSQWLWGHKRWKRNRTQRIVLLSDGKPGHVKQSETLLEEIRAVGGKAAPPYEILAETVEVRFASKWRRRLFPVFALFFMPWAQGRLRRLRFFLTPECAERIEQVNPDIVISAGTRLVPLNLCLGRENLSKSVVVMKPGFPFNLFRYDLALVPFHDRGLLPRGTVRIQGALSPAGPEALESSKRKLIGSLPNPERVRLGLFLGGETRGFKLLLPEVENLIRQMEQASEAAAGDYLVTTSRRTPEKICRFLQEQLNENSRCQLCVIASQDRRPEVVPGMMALADFLIVTEDSLSMISEAVSSGKAVVVVKMSSDGLPRKHTRFQESLKKDWGVPVVSVGELAATLGKIRRVPAGEFLKRERNEIREKLEGLLS